VKIGLILPGFSASESDWCIPALLDLVRELGHKHQVHIFALRYPHRRQRYTVHGAQVHAFGGGVAAGLRRLPHLVEALSSIVSEARRLSLDVLHGIWADEPGFLAVTAGRFAKIPTVVSLAGGELVGFAEIGYGGQLSRINRWLVRRALDTAHQVTVGSRLLGQRAASHGACAQLHVVPLGVDRRRFHPGERTRQPVGEGGRDRLLHVASLVPVKDQAIMLDAFAQVVAERPGALLEIAGDGPLRQSLQTQAAALDLAANVRFHGAVPHERLPELYRAAGLFLLSSRYESQNLAVLEAAACGTPVVGTAVGVVPELAPPGCVVAPGDADALARAILSVLADDERRQTLAHAQQDVVAQQFALECTVRKLTALYGQARYR
jgi:glycosyltransferase involved in cell wall biosynthesis